MQTVYLPQGVNNNISAYAEYLLQVMRIFMTDTQWQWEMALAN